MKKLSVFLLLFIGGLSATYSQHFYRDTSNWISKFGNLGSAFNNVNTGYASIYRSQEWRPYTPQKAGKITNLYIGYESYGAICAKINIYMGYQNIHNFNGITQLNNSAFTQVVYDKSISVPKSYPPTDGINYIVLSLDDTNFYYRPNEDLIVVYAQSAPDPACGIQYLTHQLAVTDSTSFYIDMLTFKGWVGSTAKYLKETRQIYFGFDMDSTQLLSIRDIDRHGHLQLYPNPAKDKLYIADARYGQSYMVSDITGKIVLQGKMKQEGYIEIMDLEPALYIIKLGHQTMKFLKE